MGRSLEAGVGPSKRNFAVRKSKPRETLRVARKHAALGHNQPTLTQAKPRFLNRTNRQRQHFCGAVCPRLARGDPAAPEPKLRQPLEEPATDRDNRCPRSRRADRDVARPSARRSTLFPGHHSWTWRPQRRLRLHHQQCSVDAAVALLEAIGRLPFGINASATVAGPLFYAAAPIAAPCVQQWPRWIQASNVDNGRF